MNTPISPENEALLAELVASGSFASPAMALDEALRLLRSKLQLEQELIAGLDSGEPIDANDTFWAARREDFRRRHPER